MLKSFNIRSPQGMIKLENWDDDKSITPQLERGVYEPHVQAIIAAMTQPNFKVLDVGANIGIHSILFSKICSDVTCIEASSENVDLLKRNYELNNMVLPTIFNEFLGDGSTLTFSRAQSNHACSFTATTDHSQRNEIRETVTTKKIDEIIKFQPDLIKMDIEGAEYNTMMACPGFFSNTKFMIVELNKFTNEKFFNQPIQLLTDLLLTMYRMYIPYQGQLHEVDAGWLANYFLTNLMLDALCVNKVM